VAADLFGGHRRCRRDRRTDRTAGCKIIKLNTYEEATIFGEGLY
jgi:hypothetical protein